jgi:hypothetical protein
MKPEPTLPTEAATQSHSVDQPVRLCVAERDVPYTVGGNVVWERESCGAVAMEGSKFCMWHHRDDYLKPEDLFPNASDHRCSPEDKPLPSRLTSPAIDMDK